MDNKQTTPSTSQPNGQFKLPLGCYMAIGWVVIIAVCSCSIVAISTLVGFIQRSGGGSGSPKSQLSQGATDGNNWGMETESQEAARQVAERSSSLARSPLYYGAGCDYYVYSSGEAGMQRLEVAKPELSSEPGQAGSIAFNDASSFGGCQVISEWESLPLSSEASPVRFVQSAQVIERSKRTLPGTNTENWSYRWVRLGVSADQQVYSPGKSGLQADSPRQSVPTAINLPIDPFANFTIMTLPVMIAPQNFRFYALKLNANNHEIWKFALELDAQGRAASLTPKLVHTELDPGLIAQIPAKLVLSSTGSYLALERGGQISLFATNAVNAATEKLTLLTNFEGQQPVFLAEADGARSSQQASTLVYFRTSGTGLDLLKYKSDSAKLTKLQTGIPEAKITYLTTINQQRLAFGGQRSYEFLLDSLTLRDLGDHLTSAASHGEDVIGVSQRSSGAASQGSKIIKQTGESRVELMQF